MNITTITGGGSRYFRSKLDLYVENLNNSFNKVKVRAEKQLKPYDQSQFKSVVAVDPGFLDKAMNSERTGKDLESKLRGLPGANDAFANIRAAGHNISLKGYTIDKKGNITAYGTDLDSKEAFEISLGRVGDDTKFKDAIYEHFNVTTTQLLFNSNATFDLFA